MSSLSASDGEQNSSPNLKSRPKRAIHFKKLNLTSDLLKQLENMPDDESDDEEFLPVPLEEENSTISSNSTSSSSSIEEIEVPIVKQESKKPRKRRRIKKKAKIKNFDSDQDTEKLINSFKNSKIVKKLPKQQTNQKHATSGPYIKKVEQKLTLSPSRTLSYSMYIIKNHNNTNDQSVELSSKYKLIVPKEKQPVLVDSKTPWLCSLCLNAANCLNGLGDLYGPYRINKDQDLDLNEEIWLHEGCAVWSPEVYVKDNRVFGLEDCLKSALEWKCNSCKKAGANLMCKQAACNRVYHYPCAIKNDCTFDEENFTILCKAHSESN